MIDKTRHIDLKLPTGWNQCTTAQLELIAQILLRRMAMQDRYHPYDPIKMKTEAFFALTGITIVKREKGKVKSEDDSFLVRMKNQRDRSLIGIKRPIPLIFPLHVWQVHSFIDQHLKWLDDFTGLLIFPYPTLGHYWTVSHRWPFLCRHTLEGPAPLLDGMTWRQYRFANEWLNAYVEGESSEAREGFLKALFDIIDLKRTPRRLRRLRPDQFQLCLIWWQSMMAEMQKKYRRCFKSEKSGKSSKGQSSNPVDLYTRSTATLQDKYHLTEDEINRQPCRVILQHLDDLAHEAEEMEKINKKNKTKR